MSSTKGYFTRSHVKELALKNQFKAQGRYSKAGPSVSRGPVERMFVLGSLGAGKSSFLASLLAHSMGNVGQRITHVTVSTGSTVPTARDLMIDLYKVGSRFGTGPKERVLPHTGAASGESTPFRCIRAKEMIAGGLKAATERTFPHSWKLIGIKDPDEQETLVTRPSRNVLDDSERVLGFYESYRRLLEDHLLLNYRRSNVQPKITIIDRLRIGDTLYPLVHPVVGEYQRDEDGAISFRIQETGALFAGRGSSAEAALNDWLEQVHRAFQIIYPKCPFERTDEQEIQWGALTRFIDVQEYASQSTVTVHDIGVVKAVRPLMIAWYDEREETIGLDKMPRELAALEVGQWFECDVVRTQRTWDLKRVLSVRPIDPIQNLTEEGVQDFWQSLAPLSPRTEQDQEIRD